MVTQLFSQLYYKFRQFKVRLRFHCYTFIKGQMHVLITFMHLSLNKVKGKFTMSDQMIFKRYEIKYLLTKEQFNIVRNAMNQYMCPDPHGKSTIYSLYFDTPDFILARRCMEHPDYKEKLRLRSYNTASPDTIVFLELKKKYDSVVYKRRISLTQQAAVNYLTNKIPIKDSQITREIDYFLQLYHDIQPAILLTYERQAFYSKNDHDFRITFDENILWRTHDMSLESKPYGSSLLSENQVLMEVKTANAIPLWLVRVFSENHIYKASFSKYRTAYSAIYNNYLKKQEEFTC